MSPTDAARHVRPVDRDALWNWIQAYTGVRVARCRVCLNHTPPFDLFAEQFFDRPPIALWHGPRGSGKSFLSGLDTHVKSRFLPGHGTRILGGSKAQSEQIYEAIQQAIIEGEGPLGSDADTIESILKQEAKYHNGSKVSILAASPTSVRGPHVPNLKLDEVDEIEPDIRESSLGMVMELRGYKASILMTSTWHRVAGPMADLVAKGEAGAFPVHRFCVFEVLERCPEERSGPNLEKCPACPLVKWCHSERDQRPDGLPKAKLSDGHYTIASLIQKLQLASERVFESDFLCLKPRATGVWFSRFEEAANVTTAAEYDPSLPVHVSVDSGVWSGGVIFQKREVYDSRGKLIGHKVNVFADYLSEDRGAENVGREVLRLIDERCRNAQRRISTDSAGEARNASGTTVFAEYQRAGLWPLIHWPKYAGCVSDRLQLIEALVCSADGTVWLTIHPRCKALIAAIHSYRRATRANQLMDYPEDPQHPHEEMIDALGGGLMVEFPKAREEEPRLRRVSGRKLV